MDPSKKPPRDIVRVPKRLVDDLDETLRAYDSIVWMSSKKYYPHEHGGVSRRRLLNELAAKVDTSITSLLEWKPTSSLIKEQLTDISRSALDGLRENAATLKLQRDASIGSGRIIKTIGKGVKGLGIALGVVTVGGTVQADYLLSKLPAISEAAELAAGNIWWGLAITAGVVTTGFKVQDKGAKREEDAHIRWRGRYGLGSTLNEIVNDPYQIDKALEVERHQQARSVAVEAMTRAVFSEHQHQTSATLNSLTRRMLDEQKRQTSQDPVSDIELARFAINSTVHSKYNPVFLPHHIRSTQRSIAELGLNLDDGAPAYLERTLVKLGLAVTLVAPVPSDDPAINALRAKADQPTDLRLIRAVGLRAAIEGVRENRSTRKLYTAEVEEIAERELIHPIKAAEIQALSQIRGQDFKDPGPGFDFGI